MRSAALAALALALCSCATGEDRIDRSRSVDRRMLQPNASAGTASAVSAYEMRPQERFRMPQPLDDASPQLPADSPRAALAPTTVCARVVISERGAVQRVDPLDDRDECRAGVAPENADLMRAVQERLLQWKFTPAAICTWPATARPPEDAGDCAGAGRIEAVPVSLMYAFTFEIREGKATVRQRRANGQ
jgi:hypothetical protein